MCQHHSGESQPSRPAGASAAHDDSDTPLEPFPWDAGVFDAHCHPTDTMASMATIPSMRTRILTVMSTRSQDQDLVSNVALEHGLQDRNESIPSSSSAARVVPCFGWHPWFSYQFYDDASPEFSYDGTPESKIAHYNRILAPAPSTKDVAFSEHLPDPRPLSEFLNETRSRLEKHPLALIGEVGLDKAFRLPQNWTSAHQPQRDEGLTPGGREGRMLSPHRVQLTHQVAVLRAQLSLAGEMGRAVSVHGVQAHGVLYDTMAKLWKGHERAVLSRKEQKQVAMGVEDFSSSSEDEGEEEHYTRPNLKGESWTTPDSSKPKPKPYPPRICLHSFSGPVEVLRQYTHPSVPAKVFFSFSVAVNWSSGGGDKTEEAIRATPDDRILAESDLHTAGEQMDLYLEEVYRRICQIKGWDLREGVERLGRNWREFVFG
ncbi:hydrolase [Durotheca rogersii]|uniref:hydrolase n=1 Tax=Durotheca rogersii TaxID=419775 RepID=UPI00221EA0A3|nr:hydrolase [Durotheca rogersii]KAI5866656.1 hydrolase [Durotheca rogersii]